MFLSIYDKIGRKNAKVYYCISIYFSILIVFSLLNKIILPLKQGFYDHFAFGMHLDL